MISPKGAALALLALFVSAAATADDAPRWRFDVEASYSSLTKNNDPWREGALRGGYRFDDGTWATGSAEFADRFNMFDTYLEARIDTQVAPGVSIYAFAGGTPDADFRPKTAFGTGGGARLFKDGSAIEALVATLDLRYSEYLAGDVEAVNPGVELYAFKGQAWFSVKAINLWDETGKHRSGYTLRLDVEPSEGYTLFVGHADAPDTSDGVTIDTQSWFGGVGVPLNDTTTLRLIGAQELRNGGYDRTAITLALSVRM
ncbi:MAG: YaiO family outer membrane beta-barrel protein [Alphaproteobacteria bacterium]|nr:YaiO family outer membrane beta-barrel protein [Alphaproteobacteria bacterium]